MIVRVAFPGYVGTVDSSGWTVEAANVSPAVARGAVRVLETVAPRGADTPELAYFRAPELAQAAAAIAFLGGEIVATIEEEGDEVEDGRVY